MLPTTLNQKDIDVLINVVTGQHIDVPDLVDSCYQIEGFILYEIVGQGTKVFLPKNMTFKEAYPALTRDQITKELYNLRDNLGNQKFTIPSWLLPLILQIIQDIISSQKALAGVF